MTKALAPLTYQEQAMLLGFLDLGENIPFIAHQLGRTKREIHLELDRILETFQDMELRFDQEDICPSDPPAPSVPEEPIAPWQPRQFRELPIASRQTPRGTCNVTATLMGDPSAAAVERSFARPAKLRDSNHPAKWS